MECEKCSFKNPTATVTAVIVQEGKLLLLRRKEEPFKGMLDLPGGYMSGDELPEEALQRELKEELGAEANLTFIKPFVGTAPWKGKKYPIVSFVYLADIKNQKITLNEENSEAIWLSIKDLNSEEVAFDSNQDVAIWVKSNLNFDLERVRELVQQLDSTATVNERSLYKAVIDGHVVKEYDGEKLIGLGWLFIRQTMLRKQAVVEDLIVDDAYRGRGLGRRIMSRLHDWAKENDVEMIELTTNPKREAANALYQKLNYKLHPTNHYLFKME